MRQKSITGGQDKHCSRVYLTVPLVYRGLQPIGLICHVEAFRVTVPPDEDPAQVTDFPVSPSADPACPSRFFPLGTVQSDSDVHDRSTGEPERSNSGGLLEKSTNHTRLELNRQSGGRSIHTGTESADWNE